MQKMLTSREACESWSVRSPAATPVELIVWAVATLNAPGPRCAQSVKGAFVHSAFERHGCGGGPSKLGEVVRPQNPQKANCAPGGVSAKFCAVLVCVEVLSAKGIGRIPRNAPCGGGQSWLVGYAVPSAPLPGVQAKPLFGPPWQVSEPGAPVQSGQGWMPGTSGLPPLPLRRSPVR